MPLAAIRMLNPETDYERFAELRVQVETLPVTTEILRDRDRDWPAKGVRRGTVAVDSADRVLGYCTVFRRPTEPAGRFTLRLVVDKKLRRQGIGSTLYEEAAQYLEEDGATRVQAQVREPCKNYLRFAKERGFRLDRHVFEFVLAIDDFDSEAFARVIDSVSAGGIRFLTYADTGCAEEDQRRLWDLKHVYRSRRSGGSNT